MDADEFKQIQDALKTVKILAYRSRVYRWPKPGPNRPFWDDDSLYSWMVNDWIVKQPDSEQLMLLFIRLGFSLHLFIHAVGPTSNGGTRKKLVA